MIIFGVYDGNNIGDSGASGIGEGLKVNSTLTTLYLWKWGVDNVWLWISWWYDWFMIIYDEYNDNKIGEKGKKALREGKNGNLTIIGI